MTEAASATIADLQAERERLRAANAKADFEAALAATVGGQELVAAGNAARRAVIDALDALAPRLVSAIAGERDETRVHYLMSEAAHEWLTAIGERVSREAEAVPDLADRFRRGVKPRDLLTVSQWAERHRELQSGTNSPGPWNNALTPYLVEIMDCLSEHSPVRQVSFIKSSGVGGPLALDTPIPTPQGWTTMGEIREGDAVFDEAGKPCRAIYVSPVFDGRQCYEVEFSDGAVITCDGTHRWAVIDRRFPAGDTQVKTVDAMRGDLRGRTSWRYAVPLPGPLDAPACDLPIPPYALGYWLANGRADDSRCTAHDGDAHEIAALISASGWPATAASPDYLRGHVGLVTLNTPRAPGECVRGHDLAKHQVTRPNGEVVCGECGRQSNRQSRGGPARDPVKYRSFKEHLRDLGVLAHKRIPPVYLRSSIEQRYALLRGLMDGDGYAARKNAECRFSTVLEGLRDDMLELLHSLGFKPGCSPQKRRAFRTGRAVPGVQYDIGFIAYAETPVFSLARKRARQRPASSGRPEQSAVRAIVAIRPVPSVPVRCIGVDADSHLYLCGREMIPTHNTEVMFNWVGYLMHHLGNKDLLCVMPTLELRDRSFNPRLAKMIDETPALAGIVSGAKRDKANRADVMEYGARARIIKAGGNSPDSLRSDHLPYVICDEVDALLWDVGGEGDPMTLIENRQRTFSRAKTYLVSTPTKEGASRISQQYERSDKRRYYVPCPHCGEFQHLEWGGKDAPYGLKFSRAPRADGDTGPDRVTRAWYLCRHCACEIEEAHKTDMLARGRWIAERPHIKHHRGYHINALYAPTGLGLSWLKVAQKWVEAQGDSAELKAFTNTYLGEVFSEKGDSIENLSLISRLEIYPAQLPARLRTAGVDVQKDRLEATIVDWGDGEQAWVRDHIIIPGDTTQLEVWVELNDVLRDAGVQKVAIDSGYNASQVYAFVGPRGWAWATKGVTGMSRPLIEDEKKRRQRLRVKRKRGIPVEPIGVDGGKALLYARLKMTEPGPGYFHFPQEPAFDDEYFAQLAAEKLVTKFKGHRPFSEWVQTRPRNETLDCLLLALVAMRLAGGVPKEADALPPAAGTTETPAAPATPAPAPRQQQNAALGRSSWSSRL